LLRFPCLYSGWQRGVADSPGKKEVVMRFMGLIMAAVAVLILASGSWLAGQDKAGSDKGEKPLKKEKDAVRKYAKLLNLTDEQLGKTTRILEEYGPKVKKLEAEIKELRQQEMKAFLAVLTDEQRAKLKELMTEKKDKGKEKDKTETKSDKK
jgi:Spy/CpxP family protein refolding chaperone